MSPPNLRRKNKNTTLRVQQNKRNNSKSSWNAERNKIAQNARATRKAGMNAEQLKRNEEYNRKIAEMSARNAEAEQRAWNKYQEYRKSLYKNLEELRSKSNNLNRKAKEAQKYYNNLISTIQ